jgi:hypothetical protein
VAVVGVTMTVLNPPFFFTIVAKGFVPYPKRFVCKLYGCCIVSPYSLLVDTTAANLSNTSFILVLGKQPIILMYPINTTFWIQDNSHNIYKQIKGAENTK